MASPSLKLQFEKQSIAWIYTMAWHWLFLLEAASLQVRHQRWMITWAANEFKSATLLSATHECTPKIWAKHERHSFQNWRVQIERHSFLGVSEVKECTLSKSLTIYRILTYLLNFFALRAKWNIFHILLLLIIASTYYFLYSEFK